MARFDAVRAAMARASKPAVVAQATRLELLVLRVDRSRRWNSQRLLMKAALHFYLRAYQQRDPVVFTSLFTPPELIHALGLVPFGLDTSGATAPSLGLTDRVLSAADQAWAPVDSCSVLRASLGAAHLGLLPQPMAAVCTSCLCDSTPKAFAAVADRLGRVPFLLLDMPQTNTPEGVQYLAWQLEELVHELERLSRRRLHPSRLAEAIELSNRARDHLLALNRLRLAHPGIQDAGHAIGFLYPLGLLLGSPDGVSVFGSFRTEVAAAVPPTAMGQGRASSGCISSPTTPTICWKRWLGREPGSCSRRRTGSTGRNWTPGIPLRAWLENASNIRGTGRWRGESRAFLGW